MNDDNILNFQDIVDGMNLNHSRTLNIHILLDFCDNSE